MPSATRTTRAEFLNSTLEAVRGAGGKAVSIIDRPVPFYDDMMKMGLGEAKNGGDGMRIPLRVRRHSTTTRLSTGYEPIGLTVQPTLDGAKVDWCDIIRPVVIAGREERVNNGEAAYVKLAQDREDDTNYALKMEAQQQILTGNVPAWSDAETLNGTDYTDGFIEHAAYGSQTNTCENVSKSTYAAQVGWNNQYYDAQNAFSTYGLIGMFALQNRIEALSMFGNEKIVIYGSRLGVENLKRELQFNERYLSEKELDGGKRSLVFGGTPIRVINSDLPNAGATSTTYKWTFVFVDWNHAKWTPISGYVMKQMPWKDLTPLYDVTAKLIHNMGQFNTDYLASFGLLARGETY